MRGLPVCARRALCVGALLVLVAAGVGGTAHAAAHAPVYASESASHTRAPRDGWGWPVERPVAVVRAYIAPAHDYGPGHRGIDLRPLGSSVLRAPADGVIAFSGVVVDRPLITIEHADGFVTTLEPVVSDLAPGTRVRLGDEVGRVHTGGHAAPGTVHFGVRLHGEYVNPLVLLGGVPRAVLLPCCE